MEKKPDATSAMSDTLKKKNISGKDLSTLSKLHALMKAQKKPVQKEGYNQARTQGTAYDRRDISGKRSFKSHEMGTELGHEENIPHSVHIDGKPWKKFPSLSHATNVANSLKRKGKNAVVYAEEVEQVNEMKYGIGTVVKLKKPIDGHGYATVKGFTSSGSTRGPTGRGVPMPAGNVKKVKVALRKNSDHSYYPGAVTQITHDDIHSVVRESYEKAEMHKDKASKALETSDTEAYHKHMASHHEELGKWHESKGRGDLAQKNFDKAEQHHEKGVKMATTVKSESILSKLLGKSKKPVAKKPVAKKSTEYKGLPAEWSQEKRGNEYDANKQMAGMKEEYAEPFEGGKKPPKNKGVVVGKRRPEGMSRVAHLARLALKKKAAMKEEAIVENYRLAARHGMGAETKGDPGLKVGHGVDYYHPENGDKHFGTITHVGKDHYKVLDRKTKKVHKFKYFNNAEYKKLVSEEAEQIDELKKSTLVNYIRKGAVSLRKPNIEIARGKNVDKNIDKVNKREMGMHLAAKKLAKEEVKPSSVHALNPGMKEKLWAKYQADKKASSQAPSDRAARMKAAIADYKAKKG